ncbi:MAG: hypothetical protein K0Q77_100 [Anaerosporomusa subterranea]|jgi:hypothetical protein|nr:hypothetical protein [Anaerosporomusa subterranea]
MEPNYIIKDLFEAAKWLRREDGSYIVDPNYLQEFLKEFSITR